MQSLDRGQSEGYLSLSLPQLEHQKLHSDIALPQEDTLSLGVARGDIEELPMRLRFAPRRYNHKQQSLRNLRRGHRVHSKVHSMKQAETVHFSGLRSPTNA